MATPTRDLELSYGSVQIYSKEVLGIGSYGKVCKAKCGQLPCAAKLLHDTLFQDNDPGTSNLVAKFLQECQFLSTIKHPNIVQYLGTATDPQTQRTVLLMELMDESLTRFLERLTGPLPYHSQLNICHDVALALAYLHSNAIIHRDLSSNNVLLLGEGNRAKVTDFGMSKLMDMTPLTQVPGTPVYMPPEAFIIPPHYSSKLDCFSHGVLALQIITRNFPNPGDASRYVEIEDSRLPTGRVLVLYPETERRKNDIDLIEPSHPLLPIALHCLKDRDTERPPADEVCGRLASLKTEPRYTHSVEQTREHVQRLQEEISIKDGELEKGRAELQRAKEQLQRKYDECLQAKESIRQEEINIKDGKMERGRAELQRANEAKEQLQRECDELLRSKESIHQEEMNIKDDELERGRAELQRENEAKEQLEKECHEHQRENEWLQRERSQDQELVKKLQEQLDELEVPGELSWRQGHRGPDGMASYHGAAVGHGSTAYFSSDYDVYSYIVPEDKWTKLPECKYRYFALAVVNDKLTTIGGEDRHVNDTNTLLSLSGSSWKEIIAKTFFRNHWREILPPMPTNRLVPAAATTSTHLVVAGGRRSFLAGFLATVEILNTQTLQWSIACSLPEIVGSPQITTCGGHFFLSNDANDSNKVFSCFVEDLLESVNSSDNAVWTRLANIPTPCGSSLATSGLEGHVLAIGGEDGKDNPTKRIHCYDAATDSWNVIGGMPTPRYRVLTAVLPSNELVVVGGMMSHYYYCTITCISS